MSATPFTAVFLMQYVYCGDPWQISASAFLANAICVGVLYYLLCALIRKPAAASVMIHTACALLGAINYFVSVFRGHAGSALGPDGAEHGAGRLFHL